MRLSQQLRSVKYFYALTRIVGLNHFCLCLSLGGSSSLGVGVGVGVGMGIGLGPPNGLGMLGHTHQGTFSMMHTHPQRLHPY